MHSSARSSDPESLIALRLARQEVLSRAKFHGLIPESAFHAEFESGPGLMKDQLRKLIDASSMENVTIQILPLKAHPSVGSNGALTILTFRRPWTPVASLDNPMGGSHIYDPAQVAYFEAEFENIAASALPVDQSRDLLNEYLGRTAQVTTNNGRALTAPQLEGAVWTKSSYSGDSQGQCVEVADLGATAFAGMRAIRDSKDPDGPALLFTESAVAGFLADVRSGTFNR